MDKARIRRRTEPDETVNNAEHESRKLEVPVESNSRIGQNNNISDSDKSSINLALGSLDVNNYANAVGNDLEEGLSRAEQVARNRRLWESTLPAATITYEQRLVPTKEYKYDYINQGPSSQKTPDDFRSKAKKKKFDLATPFLR